jgi:sensor domain CHASE-containing protein
MFCMSRALPLICNARSGPGKVASAPFDLYEGGRVYLLMQPVFLGKEDGGASAGRGTLIGVVALVVYCEKLLTIAPNEGAS